MIYWLWVDQKSRFYSDNIGKHERRRPGVRPESKRPSDRKKLSEGRVSVVITHPA